MPRIVFECRRILVGGGVGHLMPVWLCCLEAGARETEYSLGFDGFIKGNQGKDVGVEPGKPFFHGD